MILHQACRSLLWRMMTWTMRMPHSRPELSLPTSRDRRRNVSGKRNNDDMKKLERGSLVVRPLMSRMARAALPRGMLHRHPQAGKLVRAVKSAERGAKVEVDRIAGPSPHPPRPRKGVQPVVRPSRAQPEGEERHDNSTIQTRPLLRGQISSQRRIQIHLGRRLHWLRRPLSNPYSLFERHGVQMEVVVAVMVSSPEAARRVHDATWSNPTA